MNDEKQRESVARDQVDTSKAGSEAKKPVGMPVRTNLRAGASKYDKDQYTVP